MVVKFTEEKSGKEIEYIEKFWANKKILKIDGQELKRLSSKIFENEKTKEQFTLKGSSTFGLNLVNAKNQQIVLVRKITVWELIASFASFLSVFIGLFASYLKEGTYFYDVLKNSSWVLLVSGLAGFLYAVSNIRKYEKWKYKILMCSITMIACAVLGILLTMFAVAVIW